MFVAAHVSAPSVRVSNATSPPCTGSLPASSCMDRSLAHTRPRVVLRIAPSTRLFLRISVSTSNQPLMFRCQRRSLCRSFDLLGCRSVVSLLRSWRPTSSTTTKMCPMLTQLMIRRRGGSFAPGRLLLAHVLFHPSDCCNCAYFVLNLYDFPAFAVLWLMLLYSFTCCNE